MKKIIVVLSLILAISEAMSYTRQDVYNEITVFQGIKLKDTPEMIGYITYIGNIERVTAFWLENDTVYQRLNAFKGNRKDFEKACKHHLDQGRKITRQYTEDDWEINEFCDGIILMFYSDEKKYYMTLYKEKEYEKLVKEEHSKKYEEEYRKILESLEEEENK